MSLEFQRSINANQSSFGLDLSDLQISSLSRYFDLVQQHNAVLHLVGPCTPEEFATRHVLESLTLLEYLPLGAKLVDVGAGAGLPSIPCLIVREDLRAVLIESKEKKAKFLAEAVATLGLKTRANIVNRQFEESDPSSARFVTCRALDKFTEKLPRIVKWSKGRKLLFFGGPTLRDEMKKLGLSFGEKLLPFSTQRYLFVSDPGTN